MCCISFQLGFCCCSGWHIWAHFVVTRILQHPLCLLSSPPTLILFILQGAWRTQMKVREVLQLAVRLLMRLLLQWGHLLGTAGKGIETRGDLYNVMPCIYHREESSQLEWPSTVPTSLGCSAFLLFLRQLLVSLFFYSQHTTVFPVYTAFLPLPKTLLKNLPELLQAKCQFGGCV